MFIILIIKGFLIGIAFIIPGLSGGTLAIYLGVYEQMLDAIGKVFTQFKKSFKFLLPIVLGVALSVVLLAKLFGLLMEWNSMIVLGFFIGLILGGVKDIFIEAKDRPLKKSSIIAFMVAFGLVIFLIIMEKVKTTTGIETISITPLNLLIVFLLGMAASMTMIVPGVSGSALLLVLGYYTAIVSNVIGNILDFSNLWYHLQIIIPFGIGAAFGIIAFSRLITLALQRYHKQTYAAILGFILASIIAIFFEIRDPATADVFSEQVPIFKTFWSYISSQPLSFVFGLVTLCLGFFATRYLTMIEKKRSVTND